MFSNKTECYKIKKQTQKAQETDTHAETHSFTHSGIPQKWGRDHHLYAKTCRVKREGEKERKEKKERK